ncbi:Mif2/CENP-C like-domain-containing protein [Protomyces lactucae-debilis]|uniref:CENP-C homolog n=1 Tax=Protomyces lactucae-debilis TaxID=2754530 RepID=A0A1Y2F435_PROLT|nr:Mif2/CENP-C like-domain-containing protein [Protomyces lactucae-debilis]ORY78660.1 Mif2/CENP-C like-domain-containing protein [Protomyces lactucae-debilis]
MPNSQARYSEAERRGRGAQNVTDIGVKGRRTGLEIYDTTRDEDGMENLSAFFSPATAKKKAAAAAAAGNLLDSAHSIRSRPSTGSNEQEMEIEASSAQDVTATLSHRRQSQAASAVPVSVRVPNRHSQSPTKTHLNSPALRVRNAVSNPASPLRNPHRAATTPGVQPLAKVARKLDFSRSDLDVEDEEEDAPAAAAAVTKTTPAAPARFIAVRRSSKSPAATSASAKADRKRKVEALQATERSDGDDDAGQEADEFVDAPTMAEIQGEAFEDLAQPDPLPNAQNDDVRYDVEYEAPNDEPMYQDYIDDGAELDEGAEQAEEEDEQAERSVDSAAEEDEDEEEPIKSPASNKKRSKSAQRAATDHESDAAPRKRGRSTKKPAAKKSPRKKAPARHASLSPSRAASRTRDGRTQSPQREWREPITHDDSDDAEQNDGVRRSTRVKVPPLAFWRGEKMVFGRGQRRKSVGGTLGLSLPEVKEIIHVDLVEGAQQVRRSRASSKGRANGKKKRRANQVKDESSASEPEDEDEEEEHIIVEANVRSFEQPDALVKKVLAIPQAMYDPRPVVGQGIFFQKTLSEEPHFAAGVLDIPVGEGKPVKPSKQNTMFFFIYQGYVQVKIHDVIFKLRKGGQFTVPRGNFYEIVNVGTKDARLFFSQSTDTLANANMQQQQPKRR